jgi:hypothetical protein
MSGKPALSHGVMEGKGAYIRHARLQVGGIALALPFLEKVVRNVNLHLRTQPTGNQPAVIADYGSSQAKNSLAPMHVAVRALRDCMGPHRPLLVFHVDQPANDCNTLFEVLNTDPDRYGLGEPERISLCDWQVVLRKSASPRVGPLRVVLLCGHVAEPHPNPDSGLFDASNAAQAAESSAR